MQTRAILNIAAVSMMLLPGEIAAATPAKHTVRTATAASPKAEPAICASLMSQYEDASKKLALNQAEDNVDDSAPRSAMRQTENTATIAQAQTTIQIMASNGCKAPTFAPSASRYAYEVAACTAAKERIHAQQSVDRLSDETHYYPDPDECDTSKWKSN